jgi:transcriptional regulator with XRE-family HTH domain
MHVRKCWEDAEMRLRDWIKTNGTTQTELAAMVDLSPGMMSRICNGYLPSPAAMIRIAAATKGAVLPNDFFENLPISREDKAA